MRAWNPTMGMGDLEYKPRATYFVPDSKSPPRVEIPWVEARTGQANRKAIPRKKAEREEWDQWLTFTTASGEVMTFRRNGPPPR